MYSLGLVLEFKCHDERLQITNVTNVTPHDNIVAGRGTIFRSPEKHMSRTKHLILLVEPDGQLVLTWSNSDPSKDT